MESVRISLMDARRLAGIVLLGLMAALAQAQDGAYVDPPGRIAYLSDSAGRVSFSPAGAEDWLDVHRNRPLIPGDSLWTDRDARVELQVGTAFLRLGSETAFTILALDDDFAQFEVTEGVLQLNVRRLLRGQAYEIATPNLAFVVDRVGRYRVEVDPYRNETTLMVWNGGGEAWGERGSFALREGEAVVFRGTDLRDYRVFGLPREDAFDLYCLDRDRLIDRSPTLRYVDDELAGYASLDAYGSWRSSSEYGAVWYPTRVDTDWAPYRDGHWVYQSPWGWTWVDNAPWGFAPSHYGRWVYVSNRWGWVPGPRHVRPIYAPALVVFVGGDRWQVSLSHRDRSPIGWFPLGPRDVYVPSYRVSRDYFSRVNVHNTVVNVSVINNIYVDYARGGDYGRRIEYAHRGRSSALTAVPRDVFTSARDVRREAFRLERGALTNARFSGSVDYAPNRRAVLGAAAQARNVPQREVFDRGVIARTPPAFRGFGVADPQPRQGAPRGSGPVQTPSRAQQVPAVRDNVRVIDAQRRGADMRNQAPQQGRATEGRALPDRVDRGRGPDTQRQSDVRGREREVRGATQRPREVEEREQPSRGIKEDAERQRQADRQFEAEARQRESAARDRAEREQQSERQRQQRVQDESALRQRDAAAREQNQRDQIQRDQMQRDQMQRDRMQREQNQRDQQRENAARQKAQREREAALRQREADQRVQAEARQRESEARGRAQREQEDIQRQRQMRDQAEAESRQRENAERQQAQREREAAERQRQAEQQAENRQRESAARESAQREQAEIQRQRLEQTQAEAEARRQANAERRKREEESRRGRGDDARDDE